MNRKPRLAEWTGALEALVEVKAHGAGEGEVGADNRANRIRGSG